MTKSNWTTVAESKFPWERDALDFLREQFPSHDPYRAWSNFEFIADDGSINEVDSASVYAPRFLPGRNQEPARPAVRRCRHLDLGDGRQAVHGRQPTDRRQPEGQETPVAAATAEGVQEARASRRSSKLWSSARLRNCGANCKGTPVSGSACGTERPPATSRPVPASWRRSCVGSAPGLEPRAKGTHDRPMAKLISQAMDQAGIRPSQRMRKVSDYVLEQLIGEGPGYQDWQARHTQVAESKRRVRLYLVRTEATKEDRDTIQRAALREFQILETLEHPGILRAYNFTEHELGPALLFEHDPFTMRLDHYLAQQKDKLSVETQLDLMRQVAEVIRYAHDKKVVHRGLCPQSILVTQWHGSATGRGSRSSTGRSGIGRGPHPRRLASRCLPRRTSIGWWKTRRPPTWLRKPSPSLDTGEHLDVFSLGAIAYHIFSGAQPGRECGRTQRKAAGNQGPANQLGAERGERVAARAGPVCHQSRGAGSDGVRRGLPGHARRSRERADLARARLRSTTRHGPSSAIGCPMDTPSCVASAKGPVPWRCWWSETARITS